MRLAAERQKAGDTPAAIRNLERAAQLVPGLQGKQNPNLIIATLALEKNDTTRALQAFDAFLAVDGNDVEAARKRAQLLEPLGDAARTAAAYQRVVDVDPFDSHAQTMVGRMALQRRDAPAAIRAFRSALASRPPDEAAAHLDLAAGLLRGGAGGRRQARSARRARNRTVVRGGSGTVAQGRQRAVATRRATTRRAGARGVEAAAPRRRQPRTRRCGPRTPRLQSLTPRWSPRRSGTA